MAEQNGGSSLLTSIIQVSEKAGKIARICRQDAQLLALLVQEKKESEKNPRYVHDFKTLADVLVQEVVKYELCSKFPALIGHIYGEESNKFDLEHESVTIEIKPKVEETVQLLAKVLPDADAANTLAEVVHSADIEVNSADVHLPQLPQSLAIWIDPIDSTAEYISGNDGELVGRIRNGLSCVTVLIGVFDRDTGLPIIGVINQPFYRHEQETWHGRYVYGVCFNDFKITRPVFPMSSDDKLIAVSSSESNEIKCKLSTNGFNIVEIAGAGYKLLNIVLGQVDGYVLTKATTFMWDICAAHAILRSLGGDIVDYTSVRPIRYRGSVGIKDSCNRGGLIAFRDPAVLQTLIHILGLQTD